jgi:ABC-type sugar transport system ATPase subunit
MTESAAPTQTAAPAIRYRNVSKRFGGTTAVDGVSLSIAAGSVHAFVGENGAGKSTLMGMLAGRIALTDGEIEVFGQTLQTGNVRSSRAAGVVAIYQELTIVPDLSACANVFLGQSRSRFGFLSERWMRDRFNALCERLGVVIAAEAPAGTLPVSDQQLLEILRALQSEARILLLDEPTSALPPPEREALFRRIRELRARGVTILLVSHNLDEVLAIADDISVCRDGCLVRSAPAAAWSKASLIAAMLGHTVTPAAKRSKSLTTAALLRTENLSVPGKIENICLEIRANEILGLGGLIGAGRTTVLRALYGLEPEARGSLWIDGTEQPLPTSPTQALALGIALIPEDRRQGLVLGMSAQENIVLADLGSIASAGFISERRLRDCASVAVSDYEFDRRRLPSPAGALSGGNQQKLLLARWRHRPPRILLADEPTRGIDIGAKEEIMANLRALADNGLAVVFVSSEIEEVVAVSDRILVLAAGREAGHLGAGAAVSDILTAAFSFKAGAHV